MPAEYDFQKYKPLIREYVKALRPGCDAGNFQCLNPDHPDGGTPSQWSMGWGKAPNTLHCYGCGTGGHDWDIYDLVGAIEGISTKGEQYKRVAAIAGDVVGLASAWIAPPSVAPEPEFVPDDDAIETVYEWLKAVRGGYRAQIDSFCQFRGQPADWGNRLAWWPGLSVARTSLSEETLIRAGLFDPLKPTAAFNAEGAIVRLGRGFKLHYAGKPDADGHVPTIKRGSRGCHTFPYPALPDGDTVVLVEGELDAVSGRYAGIPTVSIGGTNGLTAADAETLVGRRVILALDNDEPGRKAIQKIALLFHSCLTVDWSLPECAGEKDIDDMVKHGKSEFVLKMIENAKEVEDEYTKRGRDNSGDFPVGGELRNTAPEDSRGNGGVQSNDKNNTEGRETSNQGAQGNGAQHDAGSTGTANHGNDKRHEGIDRGDEGNAENDQSRERGNGERNSGTRGVQGNEGRECSTRVSKDADNSPSPHDEDGIVTPQDIPFQFLGFDEGAYYFMPKLQNVAKRVGCTETAMKQMIFDLAPESWWLTYFSRTSEKGVEYVDTTAAIEWLRACSTRRGMFNNEKLLGTGVYKDTNGAIVNTGYALVTPDGSVSRFNEYQGKLTFVRSPVELVVSGEAWTAEDGRHFYEQLKTFGFESPLSYYSVAGWCALAPFASFLFRRPHIWIVAKRGMGKTYLIDNLISPILGEDYAFYTDGSTEAGIRQSLYRDNRPVILDEFEANKKYDIDSLERILELSRSAYGGKKKVKGSQSQKAISFTLKVMFCFASINVNISNDADRSRIAVCRMTESTGRMGAIENPDGLRARIFNRLDEVNPNILAVHRLMEALQYEDRTADTYSPLLAGTWMILSDIAFPSTEAERDALPEYDRRLYDHLLASLPQTAQTEEKRPDEERILEEVFQSRIRLESGSEKTVSEMLTTLDDMKKLIYDDHIQRFGLRRGIDREGTEYLAVVHDSKEIKSMLKDTPFAVNYKEVLKRNPAYMATKQIHVAKQQMSCILLRWSDIEARYFKEEADVVPF